VQPGLTHEQYLREPNTYVDWALRFAALENEIEAEEIKKAQKESSG
jgi:hypothetical protein